MSNFQWLNKILLYFFGKWYHLFLLNIYSTRSSIGRLEHTPVFKLSFLCAHDFTQPAMLWDDVRSGLNLLREGSITGPRLPLLQEDNAMWRMPFSVKQHTQIVPAAVVISLRSALPLMHVNWKWTPTQIVKLQNGITFSRSLGGTNQQQMPNVSTILPPLHSLGLTLTWRSLITSWAARIGTIYLHQISGVYRYCIDFVIIILR